MTEHGNKGKKRQNSKTEDACAWMQRYFTLLGDFMPHTNRIHLPSWDSQKFVYARYQEDMLQGGAEAVSLRTFYRVWSENVSHVVIPEVRITLVGHCTYNDRI